MPKLLQNLEKIWFVWLRGVKEGPFSFYDLRKMKEVTPDTWAWREGMHAWLKIRDIPELFQLFSDEEEEEEALEASELKAPEEDAVLSLPNADPPWIVWFLLALLLVFYALFLALNS